MIPNFEIAKRFIHCDQKKTFTHVFQRSRSVEDHTNAAKLTTTLQSASSSLTFTYN